MKKNVFIIVSIFMISSLIATPAAISAGAPMGAATADETLVYGTISLAGDLDPHFAWDSASIDHQNQVVEGLFAYNLASPNVEIVPRLAATCGSWSEDLLEFTVPLREDVLFHDGTPFNAEAVKFNFDRLTTFIEEGRTQIAELYEPLASLYPDTPILINNTEVLSEFEVKITLNYPYVVFLPLMCFSGSAIMSPTYWEGVTHNASEFLDIGSDLLVGTGPFVHVSTDTTKTVFVANPTYYRGVPAVKEMQWVKYEDSITASTALLAGDIDMGDVSTTFMPQFEASENVSVGVPMKGTSISYMGMNNKVINKTMRQAISYAFDYDYMITNLLLDNAARLISPIPEGIAYHQNTTSPAVYNLTIARGILIDAGLSHGLTLTSTDQEWRDMASADPIATYGYQFNLGNSFRTNLGIQVGDNCEAIGIAITQDGMEWSAYLTLLLGDFDGLELYMIGWGPDYNDPSNFINPLFSNTSASNGAQVNDPWLQAAMMEALVTADLDERRDLYYDIQSYIVEDLMPWVFLFVSLSKNVLYKSVTDWNRNPMGQLEFFACTFNNVSAIYNEGFDPALAENCGYEIVAPTVTETETTTTGDGIPGYSLLALIGVAAITIFSVIKRRK